MSFLIKAKLFLGKWFLKCKYEYKGTLKPVDTSVEPFSCKMLYKMDGLEFPSETKASVNEIVLYEDITICP